MNIEEIKNNTDLLKKLQTIYKNLDGVMKDDVTHNKFSYSENEISPLISVDALNQHIASNRLKKIINLSDLSENWENFNTLYKDDVILKKIGVEFLEGKLEFDKKTIDTIKDYPHRAEVLYYFTKGKDVDLSKVKDNYLEIKNKIFPSLEKESIIHLEQKKALLKSLLVVNKDKSEKNLNYLVGLSDGITSSGKINVEWGDIIGSILKSVKEGNFIAQQKDNIIVVELPISGNKKENGIDIKSPTTLLSINLENPKEYSLEVGNLKKPELSVIERMKAIRESALKISTPSFSPNKMGI